VLQRFVKWIAETVCSQRVPGIRLESQSLVTGGILNLPGVAIRSCRDSRFRMVAEFAIERGNEIEAIENLLRVLDAGGKFSLADPRKDVEGAMIFRRLGEHLLTMSGGHGWSSEWKIVEHEVAVRAALEIVKYNYGDSFHDHGDFSLDKLGTSKVRRLSSGSSGGVRGGDAAPNQ
jgi:hypothetical protein